MALTMKHLFTLLAAISLLICAFFVVMTAMSFSSPKKMELGQHGERTYSLIADSLEFTYQGKLTTFDDKDGFSTDKKEIMGMNYDVQHRKAINTPTKTMTEATGFILVVPALYPIAVFAILPLVWVVGAFRKKKPLPEVETAGGPPPLNRA